MTEKKAEYLLLYHCAPTLYKKKSASLFSLGGIEKAKLPYITNTYTRLISSLDLKLNVLCACESNALIYVYNESRLSVILSSPRVLSFLNRYGYGGCKSTDDFLAVLKSRIKGADAFPHEIGIFLDYPLYDVEKFIANKGRNFLCSGDWKAYHDKSGAIRKFNTYKKCRSDICRRLDSGLTADEILCKSRVS